MKVAFFDFDGTITTHDSFRDFLLFAVGTPAFLWGMIVLSPWLVGYVLKIIPNWKAKQRVVKWFFEGKTEEELDRIAKKFVTQKLNSIVKPSAMKKMLWHIQQEHKVMVVSASFELYLKHWCKQHDLELCGSKLEIIDGKITGKILGKNCWGPEKVERIKKIIDLEKVEYVYAYGDSRGDREMLEMANEAGYRNFQ
jgi:HAD superfamily hydrolase (TIGR01490 family)